MHPLIRSKLLAIGLSLLLILSVITTRAQNLFIKHYSYAEGLPSNTLYRIIQDRQGFIWFGSDVGATRFDGKKFENYNLSDGLSDNEILGIREDSKGRIWFLGFNGTVSYWFNGRIYNESSDELLKQIKTISSFVDLFEDSEHRIWFIAQTECLYLQNNKITRPNPSEVPPACIISNFNKGQLFLSASNPSFAKLEGGEYTPLHSRYSFDGRGAYVRLANNDLLYSSNDGVIRVHDTVQSLFLHLQDDILKTRRHDMELTGDNKLWISTTNGLFCFNTLNRKDPPEIYLRNKIPSALLTDRAGNLWISTLDDGLYMIPVWSRNIRVMNKKNGLPDDQCYAVLRTDNRELMVGLKSGKVSISTGNGFHPLPIPKSPLTDFRINKMLCSGNDLLIASDNRLVHYNTATHTSTIILTKTWFNTISEVLSTKDMAPGNHSVFIACNYSVFEYSLPSFDLRKKAAPARMVKRILTSFRRIFSICNDHNNELWFGTSSGLMSKNGSQAVYRGGEDPLLSKRINGIVETKDSTLVLATHGYGLLFYRNKKILRRLTVADGLSNNICRRVFIHGKNIYVATPSGVSLITYELGKIKHLGNLSTSNFLPVNDVNDVYATDSLLYVATMTGLVEVSLNAIQKDQPQIPDLKIREVFLNDTLISSWNGMNLSYRQNSLRFHFSGIYFQAADEVNYRYRLKENSTWNYTKNNFLDFSFLSPGEYSFQIQARVQKGNWSPAKVIQFTIHPPFWNTGWFQLLIWIFIGLIIYVLVKQRVEKIRTQQDQKVRIEKQITNLEQQALQSMMNPHFIFNVMNSIQHFINANDNKAANQYLSDFAKLIRMNLTISYKKFIPLEEEVSYLQLYLSFEKLRFGENLNYEISIDPHLDRYETHVAVMMIQPFLENAIWHGILPMHSIGQIRLEIIRESDALLKVVITDNGIGIKEEYLGEMKPNAEGASHGMNMTFQRLQLLCKASGQPYHLNFKHVYSEGPNKGTILEMNLPSSN